MRVRVSAAAGLLAAAMAVAAMGFVPTAGAQGAVDLDVVVGELESRGYYIEPGADGDPGAFADLVSFAAANSDDAWYFVSLAAPVEDSFAGAVADQLRPEGNVLVYFFGEDAEGPFVDVLLSSLYDEATGSAALSPFDGDWVTPDEFMRDVVTELDRLTEASSGSSSASDDNGGSGVSAAWLLVPLGLIVGGIWFASRRSKKKREASQLETATKIRTEIQKELDELANDVLVLSGPIDLSDDAEAIRHYREAAATYTAISDEIPDLDELEKADLGELSELGARVVHARWQMDAAEALLDGEPIPDKPEVEPPPEPPEPSTEPPPRPTRLPQRQPRARVPYSRSRHRGGGGGLLDILIAGGGMLGGGRRRRGGMFGGGSGSAGTRSGGSSTRRRGGVFGSPSSGARTKSRTKSSRSSRRRSTSRSRSRSSTRRSSSRRSSSRSRRSTSRRRRR